MKGKRTKIFAGILLLFFLFRAIAFEPQVARAQIFGNGFPRNYDMVALVVDEEVYADTRGYNGLSGDVRGAGLSSTTISARIHRYAEDIQKTLSTTRAVILPVSKNERVEDIANVLERMYFEGDPEKKRADARLVGAVFVGEVPLPIVEKSGTRFLSMFPYADFEEKAYVWNDEKNIFERDFSVSNPSVEIWHGVIRPPVSSENPRSQEFLAQFFDKNHLYHTGNPAYADFGKNLLYSDFFFEQKGINPLSLGSYSDFTEHLEDKAYYRNTREFLGELRGDFENELEDGEENGTVEAQRRSALAQARRQAEALGFDVPAGNDVVQAEESLMPDILTKPLISKYLSEYKDIFTSFPALMNDFARYTGRYDPNADLDTMVNLLTAKDKYTMLFLREANDRLEEEMDRYIETRIAEDIPIIDTTNIFLESVTVKKPDASGTVIITGDDAGFAFPETEFSNHSLTHHLEKPEDHDLFGNHIRPPTYQGGVWGVSAEELRDVSQCSLYRGSLSASESLISKAVVLGRQYFLKTAGRNVTDGEAVLLPPESEDEARREFRQNPYSLHGGCYALNASTLSDPAKNRCFPELSTSPVMLPEGTKAQTFLPQEAGDYRSCYLFHEKTAYQTFYQFVAEYLDAMSASGSEGRREALTVSRGIPPEQNRDPSLIPLFATLASADLEALGLSGVSRASLKLNLNDVVSRVPGASGADPLAVSRVIADASVNGSVSVEFSDHPYFSGVVLRSAPDIVKYISSIFYHKEPTAQTLSAQVKGLVSKDLPIDNPRYVTFMDRGKNLRKVDYPNVFKARSAEDLLDALALKESELTADSEVDDGVNRIFTAVFNEPEGFSIDKIQDALAWKEMDLSQKHRYLAMAYLDPFKNSYVGERFNGYELSVFNATGDATAMEIDFSGEPITQSESFTRAKEEMDIVLESVANEREEESFEAVRLGESPERAGASGCNVSELKGGLPLFSFKDFPEVCSPWLIGIKKWLGSLRPTVQSRNAENDDVFYSDLSARQEADKEALREKGFLDDEQAYLPPSEWTTFTRTASLELVSFVPVLQSDMESSITVTVLARDANGNLLDGEFVSISASVEGAGIIFANAREDDNPQEPGFQKATVQGLVSFRLKATGETGEGIFTANVPGTDISASIPITVVSFAKLEADVGDFAFVADGAREVSLNVSAKDDEGNILTSVNGMFEVSLADNSLGSLASSTVNLRDGQGTVLFFAGKKAGTQHVTVRGGFFAPAFVQLELLPGQPSFIGLRQEGDSVVVAQVFDAFGNFVDVDDGTQIMFEIDDVSRDIARFAREGPFTASGGQARATILFDNQGTVGVLATSPGLVSGVLTMERKTRITSADIASSNPESLAVALLGIPGGDVTVENNIGSWFAFSGKVQTVLTLSAPLASERTLMEINGAGGVSFAKPDEIDVTVFPESGPTVRFTDRLSGETLGSMIIRLAENTVIRTFSQNSADVLENGVYVKAIVPEITLVSSGPNKISFTDGAHTIGNVQNDGKIFISDGDYKIRFKTGDFPVFEIVKGENAVLEIIFVERADKGVIIGSEQDAPGIYMDKPQDISGRFGFKPSFSGNSTAFKPGLKLVAEGEFLSKDASPGFSYRSLEDSLENSGVGFTNDNKFALLFSAGQTFGEANIPYASDIGILLGDPTVRIDNSRADGFSKDVGRHIFSAYDGVKDMIDIDVNGDGKTDLLVAHGDGNIRYFENSGDSRGFMDRGEILSVKNGIRSIAKGDFNRDSMEDLVIAGIDRCSVTDTCVDFYENNGGFFTRKNLRIDQLEKIQLVKATDLNVDGDTDLVTVSEDGAIKAYYNKNGEFDLSGQTIGDVGLKADQSKNLISGVLVAYGGQTRLSAGDPAMRTIPFRTERITDVAFIYADADNVLGSSTKYAFDLNGGTVKSGDRLRYITTLKNDSARNINNVYVSDIFPEGFIFDPESVACEGCAPNEEIAVLNTIDPERENVFAGFSIPARSSRILSYEGIYVPSFVSSQKLVVGVGTDLSDIYPVRDRYPDIMVTAEGNPTGKARYFYSTGILPTGRVVYASALSDSASELPPASVDQAKRVLQENLEDYALASRPGPARDAKANEAKLALREQTENDPDGDGIPALIDEQEGVLDKTADIVKAGVSMLKCSTGCIALPLNYAFFAPGSPSLLGVPVGFDPGLPALDIGPPPPFVGAFGGGLPAAASTFRLYVSPTLTGGIGFGICLGPWLVGQCFNFAIDPFAFIQAAGGPDLCEKLNAPIEGAMSVANGVISGANSGVVLNIGGQQGGGSANSRESSGLVNYQLGNYEAPVSRSRNVLVPGFPSVITEWFRAQINEIATKLFDLPDLYVIYPEVSSLYGAFVPRDSEISIDRFADILTLINSMPIVDIETETVTFKIPWITAQEFERVKSDWELWISDLQNEWQKLKNLWQCGTLRETVESCSFVELQMKDLIKTMNQNLRNIEEYLLLPKKILDYAQIEERYIAQLIDYLDTITAWTGGWVKKNSARVKEWRKFARNVKELAGSWEPIFKVALQYMESCDRCKTERFTLMELVMKLFVAVPSPPVIPFPKMPDIVIDVSKIQAGARILWPDVRFQAEPLVLPKLPRFKFPIPEIGKLDANVGLQIILPKLPVIKPPPDLPVLPTPPSLLELKLPDLPDIPPPPTLPKIPSELRVTLNLFKKIVKIACLVKTGLIPVPEFNLKPQLEAQTARGLSPLLPVDTLFSVQLPSTNVDYVDKIEITAHTNFQAEFGQLKEAVSEVALNANKESGNFADSFNKALKNFSRGIEGFLSPDIRLPGQSFEADPNRIEERRTLDLNRINYEKQTNELKDLLSAWTEFAPVLKDVADAYGSELEKAPLEIVIEAGQTDWRPSGRSVSQIQASAKNEILQSDFEKSVASVRDDLIAYSAGKKRDIGLLGDAGASGDIKRFSDIVAGLSGIDFPAGELKSRLFASSNIDFVRSQTYQGQKVKLGRLIDDEGGTTLDKQNIEDYGRRLLALAPGMEPEGGPESGNIIDIGMFAYNPRTFESERILSYTFEADAETRQLFIGDDLIYSQGNNVYLKVFGNAPEADDDFHFSLRETAIMNFDSLVPVVPTVDNFIQASSSPNSSLVSFSSITGVAGYELSVSRGPESRVTHIFNAFADEAREENDIPFGRVDVFLGQHSGPIEADTYERSVVSSGTKNILVRPGEILHALADNTELSVLDSSNSPKTFTLSMFDTLPVTGRFGGRTVFSVKRGAVEIIGTEKKKSVLQPGMMLFVGEKYKNITGGMEIHFGAIGSRILKSGTIYDFSMSDSSSLQNVSLSLAPAHYFATIAGFNESGTLGTRGKKLLLNPQICGDESPPLPAVQKLFFQVPLLKTLTIDASRSIDPGGAVARFALDLSPDFAGDELFTGADNPFFEVGPFQSVGRKIARLTVYDTADNASSVDIEIEVIAPEIILDASRLSEGELHGSIIPPDSNVPIVVSRYRNNAWELIRTESADGAGRYFTDEAGRFSIPDLDQRDRLEIRNNSNEVVAEVDGKTGRVTVTDRRYRLEVLPASPPSLPTRIAVIDENGQVLSFVFFVPDVNGGVSIDPPQTAYTIENFRHLNGVRIKPLFLNDSEFSFVQAVNFGAVDLLRNEEPYARVDVNGDIALYNDSMRLVLKEGEKTDPPVFLLMYKNRALAEIFIAVDLGDKDISIIDEGEVESPSKPLAITYPFADVGPKDPLRKTLKGLFDRGIIQGYKNAQGELDYKKEQNISRAEFTKITLGMLCIVPREEAKIHPPVFSDIGRDFPLPWFYEYTKEARLWGFIYGYQSECETPDFCSFKPQNNINRAEAVKVILEALEKLGAIDLSSVRSFSDPWYEPYMEIAQDLRPFLKNKDEITGTFLLTPEEALKPTSVITRGEFAIMADRVLQIRDCYSEADSDPDGDGLSTFLENKYGTDPFDPDTDRGGIKDGVEVSRNTNPLDPRDDVPVAVNEGIFVVRPTCTQCPCFASVTYGRDLMPGDTFFGAILRVGEDGTNEILVRSKEISL